MIFKGNGKTYTVKSAIHKKCGKYARIEVGEDDIVSISCEQCGFTYLFPQYMTEDLAHRIDREFKAHIEEVQK